MIDTSKLVAVFKVLPDLGHWESQIIFEIGTQMSQRGVPTDSRLRVGLELMRSFVSGMAIVINDQTVPASSIPGVENLRLVADALRATADILDEVHAAGRQ